MARISLPVALLGLGVSVALIAASRREPAPLNGMGGFGKSFKKAVKKGTKSVKGVVKSVTKIAVAPLSVMAATTVIPLKKIAAKVMKGGKKSSAVKATAPAGSTIEYQDENGNVITEAQYNAIMDSYNQPTLVVAPLVSDPLPPVVAPPLPPSSAELQATCARSGGYWNGSMCSYGGGGQSTNYGTQHTASSEGSPAMPIQPESYETPSAQVLPQQQYTPAEEAPKVGALPWLVGGGILAAVFAAKS